MTVVQTFLNGKMATADTTFESGFDSNLINQCILHNSSARVEIKDGKRVSLGNVSECALINFLFTREIYEEEVMAKREEDVLLVIPFSSSRKRATTVRMHPTDDSMVRIFCKGAPEIVINYTT